MRIGVFDSITPIIFTRFQLSQIMTFACGHAAPLNRFLCNTNSVIKSRKFVTKARRHSFSPFRLAFKNNFLNRYLQSYGVRFLSKICTLSRARVALCRPALSCVVLPYFPYLTPHIPEDCSSASSRNPGTCPLSHVPLSSPALSLPSEEPHSTGGHPLVFSP